MPKNRKLGLYEADRIIYIPVTDISLSAVQPRRCVDSASMRELTLSIARYGILQPLSVRRRKCGGYELIAGERRLRAALASGLKEAPCIVLEVSEPESAVLALVENLQRRDLDFIDEARGLARLINAYGLNQEETAKYVGRSQSAVANKLRLLKLPPAILDSVRSAGLSERHARALLRLKSEEDMVKALRSIVTEHMNVSAADELIDSMLNKKPAKTSYIIRDLRVFLNTLERSAEIMRAAGVETDISQQESEDKFVITVSLKK